MLFQVCTEGRLILECTFDDLSRIKSWHFAVRSHRELVPRSVFSMHTQQDPSMLDQLAKNITRHGITNSTLNYLRVSFSKVVVAHRQSRTYIMTLYDWFSI
jgi:LIM domain-binding protein 1